MESPTSDIEEEAGIDEKRGEAESDGRRRAVRVVPLRDLARYAGRLIRASAAEDSDLLVTDRGHPLVLITPVSADRAVPSYVWSDEDLVERSSVEVSSVLPPDLDGDERIVAELLVEEPSTVDGITRALGWSVGRASIALVRLEIAKLAHRKGALWRLRR